MMSKTQVLNNVDHLDLRVCTHYKSELGDNVASTLTFITEFAEVQKEYPILFRQDAVSGEYQAIVLLGIQKEENLFLCALDPATQKFPGWCAHYLPAMIGRGPFSIGVQRYVEGGGEKQIPIVHVDMDHPKVSFEEGARVFNDRGGNSSYLNYTSNLLNIIRDGMQLNKPMFDAFLNCGLIEDVSIDIDLENQDKHRISGFQTINADKLSSLAGEELERLSRAGFLQAAYFVVASLSNVKRLIDVKNNRLASPQNSI